MMKLPLWLRWTVFGVIVFTSLVLPLILFESPLSKYGEIALNWAGDNELLVSFVVIIALTADVILPVPNGLTNTLAGVSLGWMVASLVVWVGLNFGACVGYCLGRFAARPLAQKMISESDFNEAEKSLQNFSTIGLILSRPVPAFAELITISAGLARISFIKFILVVGIVNIGVAVVFSGIGAAAMEANSSTLAFIGVAVLPALFYWTYIKFYKR
ncbi:MAG: TVP38/TMEM64 family protein [Gammaproteobacteria bacterium]